MPNYFTLFYPKPKLLSLKKWVLAKVFYCKEYIVNFPGLAAVQDIILEQNNFNTMFSYTFTNITG